MGHNRKTAKRLEWIQENRNRAVTNAKAIRNLASDFRKAKAKRDNELLDMESRLLGSIQNVENHVQGVRDAFEAHTRPLHRKALDWTRKAVERIRNVIQSAPSSSSSPPAPEPVDPSEAETDPAIIIDEAHGIIDEMEADVMDRLHDPSEILARMELRLDEAKGEAVDILENQELDPEERTTLLDSKMERIERLQGRIESQRAKLLLGELGDVEEDIGQEDAGRAEGEPKSDAISEDTGGDDQEETEK